MDPIINSVFKFIFAYRVSQQNLLQLSDSKVEHLSHDRRTNDFVKDHEEHLVESDERWMKNWHLVAKKALGEVQRNLKQLILTKAFYKKELVNLEELIFFLLRASEVEKNIFQHCYLLRLIEECSLKEQKFSYSQKYLSKCLELSILILSIKKSKM